MWFLRPRGHGNHRLSDSGPGGKGVNTGTPARAVNHKERLDRPLRDERSQIRTRPRRWGVRSRLLAHKMRRKPRACGGPS